MAAICDRTARASWTDKAETVAQFSIISQVFVEDCRGRRFISNCLRENKTPFLNKIAPDERIAC
jgi:hypothetical protein